MRQLAAHEVGHTLGLAHNFAASVKDRASVMDYPPPFVKLNAVGVPDLSDAYATGIGAWDKIAINFGYRDFPAGTDEKKQLDAILREATTRGFIFISDADARPEGGAHPLAHLWDSGANAVDELNRILDVRSKALSRFSANIIREGEPLSTLEDVASKALRFAARLPEDIGDGRSRDPVEHRRGPGQIRVVAWRIAAAGTLPIGRAQHDSDEVVDIAVRERIQNDAVDDAVHGRSRHDAEREGDDRGESEARMTEEFPRAIADVLNEGIEPESGTGILAGVGLRNFHSFLSTR